MAELGRRSLVLAGLAAAGSAEAMMAQVAWDFAFPSIEGGTLDLRTLRGRVLLVVNTASFCGFTRQYAGLQTLHTARQAAGLTVIGVPSGDFNQEAGSDAEVKAFCEAQFGIDFPMTTIQKVRGPEAHRFYRWVKGSLDWEPRWNFNKVLIGRDGFIAGVFGSSDTPEGVKLGAAIETALAA
jgi:glutathione peroxidase